MREMNLDMLVALPALYQSLHINLRLLGGQESTFVAVRFHCLFYSLDVFFFLIFNFFFLLVRHISIPPTF